MSDPIRVVEAFDILFGLSAKQDKMEVDHDKRTNRHDECSACGWFGQTSTPPREIIDIDSQMIFGRVVRAAYW